MFSMRALRLLFALTFMPLALIALEIFVDPLSLVVEGKEEGLAIIDASNLKVGESGLFIVEKGGNEFISMAGTVESICGTKAFVKFSPYNPFTQEYLPRPFSHEVHIGNKIIFRSLNKRGIIIAPSQADYSKLSAKLKDIDLLHPDVFASDLSSRDQSFFTAKRGMPSKADFSRLCLRHYLGLVFIVLKDVVEVKDCLSFVTLETEEIKDGSAMEGMKPFYTRFSDELNNKLFEYEEGRTYFNHYGSVINEINE